MTILLTADQMRAAEQAAMADGRVTGLELMERAGRGVVQAILETWPSFAKSVHSAVILCGPGNNGGDGFVIARLLAERGWSVSVFLYGDPANLPPDARKNHDRWAEVGAVRAYDDASFTPDPPDLWVDALFGTGLTRPVVGFDAFVEACQYQSAPVVAVDIPSGLCTDSGRFLDPGTSDTAAQNFCADLTVTFHARKLGNVLAEGGAACGQVQVVDIGLPSEPPRDRAFLIDTVEGADLSKSAAGHKYNNGHALVLTGGAGRTGASRLAAQAALRVGAGLVTLGVPGSAQQEVACQITALMLTRIDDAAQLSERLDDSRLSTVCLGPGLGLERARALVPTVLSDLDRGAVLDADALSAFGDAPQNLFDQLHPSCVLTPHGGEFARLFPDLANELARAPTRGPAVSKCDVTRRAAQRAGCVVLFKGADTVIAAADGRLSVHSASGNRTAPWLATAGAGDVLAGMIAGLMARGFEPMRAAELAAYLHVQAARHFGPGLTAEDLPAELPKVFKLLGV